MNRKIFYRFTVFFLIISLIALSIPYSTYAYQEEENILQVEETERKENILKINSNYEVEKIDIEKMEERIIEKYSTDGQLPTETLKCTNNFSANLSVSDSEYSTNSVTANGLVYVSTTLTDPYKSVCKVTSSNGEDGTGFLVGPNLMLTSNHVIFDSNGNINSNLAFKPAYDNGTYNNMSCGWQNLICNANYFTNKNVADDWCLVTLDYYYGNTLGWIPCVNYSPSSSMYNLPVRNIGYPGSGSYNGQHQYYSWGQVTSYANYDYISQNTFAYGMSGSPSCRQQGDYAVGIASSGYTSSSDGNNYTRCCKISQGIIDAILDQF